MSYQEPTMQEVCEAFHLNGVHPSADLFPLITGTEFQELCESIGRDGLERPVVLSHDGLLIDGRNRLRALLVTGATERFETLDEVYANDDYIGYVLRVNLHRRHMTPSMKAVLALAVKERYAVLAKRKQVEAGGDRKSAEYKKSVTPRLAEAIEPQSNNADIVAKSREVNRQRHEENIQRNGNGIVAPQEPSFELTIQEQPAKNRENEAVAQAAKATGASTGYIKDAQAIARDAPEVFEQVKAGAVSIPEAKRIIQIQAQKPKMRGEYATLEAWEKMGEQERIDFLELRDTQAKFNRQGDTPDDSMGNIEWAQWSWNPVTGCLHECPYCYARDIAERFYEQKFAPSFWPRRLSAPMNMKVPHGADVDIAKKNVFSNSMSDLYGRWVPDEWINAVLETMRGSPEWNFLMLTKFPKKAAEFKYSANCWIGASVDMQARVKVTESAFERINCGTRWLSLEPLIEPLTFSKPKLFDWVVIGGASKSSHTPEWVPPAEWVIRTASQFLEHGAKIYLKTNGRPREYPGVITPSSADDVFHYLKTAS